MQKIKLKIVLNLILICLVGFSIIYFAFLKDPYFMGADITQWQGDWGKLTKCLAISIENCRVVGLSMFPLGYLINSLFLQFTSFFGVTLKDEMGVINASFLLFPIVVAVLIHTLTIALRITACYLTFLLCSPLPAFYISSGALEIQAGVLIGLFISSVHYLSIEKKSSNKSIFYYGLLAVSGLLLPLYKDTNVPILLTALFLFFGFGIVHQRKKRKIIPRFKLNLFIVICITLTISIILICIYNYLKYESFLPLTYLNIANLTKPPLKRSAEFLFFSLFSLNGGLLVFWALPCCLALILPRLMGLRIPINIIWFGVTLVGVSLALLALWWVPFGWDSWGNRLIVPSMLASVIACLLTATPAGNPNLIAPGPQPINLPRQRLPKNIAWKLSKAFFMIVWLPLSFGYLVITYASDHDPLFYFSLHNGIKCKEMMHQFGEQFPKVGWTFWQTKPYYKCARERFLHIPQYIITKPQ